MKNSKRFSSEDWQGVSLLSPTQLDSCRRFFPGTEAQLSLSFINLTQLNTDRHEGKPAAATYLTATEQERLASFTFAKRHREWLGGRLAAKKAAKDLLENSSLAPISYQDLSIESHSTGRPFLLFHKETGSTLPEISISHSGDYAGALAVMGQACGLDLQQITPKVIAIRERFASPSELTLLLTNPQPLDEASALSLLWAAKESLRKAFACEPLLGFSEITLCRVEGAPHTGLFGHFSCPRLAILLPVYFLLLDDYALAITIVKHFIHKQPLKAGGNSRIVHLL